MSSENMEGGFCNYTESFCRVSTISCLKYLGERGRSVWEKVIWAVVLLACFGLLGYLVHKLMNKYQRRHYITSYDYRVTPLSHLPSPAVTLCTHSQIDMNKFDVCEMGKNLESLSLANRTIFDVLELLNIQMKTSKRHLMFSSIVFQAYRDTKLDVFNNSHCHWLLSHFDCNQLFVPILTNLGYCYTFNMIDLEELLREDVILPNIYDPDTERVPTKGFDLVKFSYNKSDEKYTYPRRISSTGASSQLSVVLKIAKQKVCAVENAFIQPNLFVALHHPAHIPKLTLDYVMVSKNKSTIIKYEAHYITTDRALKQYSPEIRECYYSNERYLRYFNYYSEENCEQECLTNLTLSECGCVRFFMPLLKNVKVCGTGKRICYNQAYLKFHTDMSISVIKCKCLPDCVTVKYITDISSTDLNEDNHTDNTDISKVTIYCSNKEVRRMTRIRTYSFLRFVANFGGVIGFVANLSIICPIELIYYFTLRLYYNKKLYNFIWFVQET